MCVFPRRRLAQTIRPASDGGRSGGDGENPPATSGGHIPIKILGGSSPSRGETGLHPTRARCFTMNRTIGLVRRRFSFHCSARSLAECSDEVSSCICSASAGARIGCSTLAQRSRQRANASGMSASATRCSTIHHHMYNCSIHVIQHAKHFRLAACSVHLPPTSVLNVR